MSNDHTVNIKAKPYHHVDLRAELVREGMKLLAARNAEDLSLREVARAVGVSANAVYRFPLIPLLQREATAGLSGRSRPKGLSFH